MIHEIGPMRYRGDDSRSFVTFEFQPMTEAHYLVLPGFTTDQELRIVKCDARGRRHPRQDLFWDQTTGPAGNAVIDLSGLIGWWGDPVEQIAVEFTRPGEISLQGAPRLLR